MVLQFMLEGPRPCTILGFNVHTLQLNILTETFLLVSCSREHISKYIVVCARSRPKMLTKTYNGPFAASGHMVHAGGQAAHWDIQNKENSNLS